MAARITDPGQLQELLGIPFTPEQLACVTAPPAPQVIVAGAGSGKTTVMAARVVWLVGTGQVAPERVLGLTFTNKAAGELAERVRRALDRAGVTAARPDTAAAGDGTAAADPEDLVGEPRVATYHAFAGQLLKDHGLRIGLEPGSRLLADASRFQLAARVLRGTPGPFPALTRPFADLVTDLLALDGELAEHLVDPKRLTEHDTELLAALESVNLTNDTLRKVPETARARQQLLTLVGAYRDAKHRRDLLDFGDQIALSATLALSRPAVGRALREEFEVVLLDEYQDTSVAQRLMLSGLFGEGTGHPVTAVGDPCQAIYGWRGASVANLDDFPSHFPRAGGDPAQRFALSENRRSGGRLLDLANTLAAPLRERHAGVRALRPAPGAERDGTVRCALLTSHAEELSWLADTLAHLVRTGTPPGEIAVLSRTAGDFPAIQRALVERDVPVEVVGLSGLLHLPEVADLVAMCEVLQDPTANASLVRLLTGPRWRIGPRDLALLGRRARALVRSPSVPSATPDTGQVDGGGALTDPAADAVGRPTRTAAPPSEEAEPTEEGEDRLHASVEGVDPAEAISLADALDTFVTGDGPDDGLPFSAAARVRFARLGTELRELRRQLADPLMDVLHRVLNVTGLEVELSASPHALAARRRETLSNFLDVAADFVNQQGGAAGEGEPTLLAFLGFLRTAAQYEKGLDNSLPGGDDTVKVLTAHKSKGLEWDVVAVPGLVAKQFPSEQPRESWPTNARVLPHELRGDAETLPGAPDWNSRGLTVFREAMREHQRTEELRLGYVTFTRPRSLLLGSGHWWGPTQQKPRGPSSFLEELRAHCEAGHGEVEAWAEQPPRGARNPALRESVIDRPWPLPLDATALARRRRAAETVLAEVDRLGTSPPADQDTRRTTAAAGDGPRHTEGDRRAPTGVLPDAADVSGAEPGVGAGGAAEAGPGDTAEANGGAPGSAVASGHTEAARAPSPPTPEEARLIASWDRDLDALTEELRRARATVRDVPLPAALSATQLLRLAADPDGLARELARPMPRPPRPAARRGTRFHAWVESRFEGLPLPLLGPEELPGGDEPEIADERELALLKEAFERSPYARRTPYRVEAPFQLSLAGRVVRGRIDAVYRDRGPRAAESAAGAAPIPDGAQPATDADGYRYEVVDWKTNRNQDADPLQLAVYRLAWAEQRGLPLSAVSAAFCYVRSGTVVRPDGLPDRSGLERVLLGESE